MKQKILTLLSVAILSLAACSPTILSSSEAADAGIESEAEATSEGRLAAPIDKSVDEDALQNPPIIVEAMADGGKEASDINPIVADREQAEEGDEDDMNESETDEPMDDDGQTELSADESNDLPAGDGDKDHDALSSTSPTPKAIEPVTVDLPSLVEGADAGRGSGEVIAAPMPGAANPLQQLTAAVQAHLAQQLRTDADAITVVSVEAVDWSDSSIGCPKPGMNYLQVITPGYRIVLEWNGEHYNYHTNGSTAFVQCSKGKVDFVAPVSPSK